MVKKRKRKVPDSGANLRNHEMNWIQYDRDRIIFRQIQQVDISLRSCMLFKIIKWRRFLIIYFNYQ